MGQPPRPDQPEAGAPSSGLGLVLDALPPRVRTAVSWWTLGGALVGSARRAQKWWNDRHQYLVRVQGDDPLYDDVQAWLLSSVPASQRRAVRVRSSSVSASGESMSVPDDGRSSEPMTPSLVRMYDGSVPVAVRVEGHLVRVSVTERESNYSGTGRASEYMSWLSRMASLQLVTQSAAGQEAVLNVLARLADERRRSHRSARLMVGNRWGGFSRQSDLPMRALDTVVLAGDTKERLVADLRTFLDQEAMYGRVGIPWHRGYLLHGPPGTGKSSLAQGLASELNMDVYWLPLADVEDDGSFLRTLAEVSPRSMLVLEDIDVIHATRDRDDDRPGKLTMQGLLNGLDSMLTPHGLVTVMTTNRRDVLDEAVVRRGRVHMEVEIGPLAGDDLRRLVETFVGAPVDGLDLTSPRLPADVVTAIAPHLGDVEAMRRAVRSAFNDGRNV